jgi:hypothetical protein
MRHSPAVTHPDSRSACGDSATCGSDGCLRIVDDDGHRLTSGDHLVMAANHFVFAPDGRQGMKKHALVNTLRHWRTRGRELFDPFGWTASPRSNAPITDVDKQEVVEHELVPMAPPPRPCMGKTIRSGAVSAET